MEARLLGDLADGGGGRVLARVELALGEGPVVVAGPVHEQHLAAPAQHHGARGDDVGGGFRLRHGVSLTPPRRRRECRPLRARLVIARSAASWPSWSAGSSRGAGRTERTEFAAAVGLAPAGTERIGVDRLGGGAGRGRRGRGPVGRRRADRRRRTTRDLSSASALGTSAVDPGREARRLAGQPGLGAVHPVARRCRADHGAAGLGVLRRPGRPARVAGLRPPRRGRTAPGPAASTWWRASGR